jgi:hypothetical protein
MAFAVWIVTVAARAGSAVGRRRARGGPRPSRGRTREVAFYGEFYGEDGIGTGTTQRNV